MKSTKSNMAIFPGQLLTSEEAAVYLRVTVRTLQNWRVKGGGPKYVKLGRNACSYRLDDLRAWVEERVKHSTSEI